jgi:glutaredoxin
MPAAPHVIFYTKPGCHLCDEARREMARADCSNLFTYEEVDINSDPELLRRYASDIPVVLVNNTHAFKHQLTAAEFRRAILRARN